MQLRKPWPYQSLFSSTMLNTLTNDMEAAMVDLLVKLGKILRYSNIRYNYRKIFRNVGTDLYTQNSSKIIVRFN